MLLGALRFAGDPTELVPTHDRVMSGFDRAALDLHICVEPNGLLVLDACPTEEVFRTFSAHVGAGQEALLSQEVRG